MDKNSEIIFFINCKNHFWKNLIFSPIIIFLFFACSKDDFAWNLKKLPEVAYLSVLSNDLNEFKLSVECTSVGFSENVEMGFCWSTIPNPTVDDNVIVVDKKNEGTYTTIIPWTNISTYHFRAYVKNDVGIAYSQNCIVNWPGSPNLPQIQTVSVDQISFYQFNVNCNLLSTGGNPITQKGVLLYDNPGGTTILSSALSQDPSNTFSIPFDGLIDGETYYVRAFASTLAGTTLGNMITVELPKKLNVGQIGPAGGYIIYEHPDPFNSWHYLEAAPVDVSNSQFIWSTNSVVTSITGVELGQGYTNSINIYSIYGNSSSYAARLAMDWVYGSFSDWVLPSFKELKLMKEQLFDQGIGNFSNGSTYWSSSEDQNYSSNAWTVKMYNTGQNLYITQGKNQLFKVRAVRRF